MSQESMTIAASHTKTFLAVRTMIEAGWFSDKTLVEIDEHLQFIQSKGHITDEEQQALFTLARKVENHKFAVNVLE